MSSKPGSPGSIRGWILLLLALVMVLALAGFLWIRENPLAVYERTTRRALERAGLELRRFEASSGPLAYWEAGEGPTLVLLHGAGDQAGAFQGIVASLLDDYRLVIPDIPGHGDSEPAEGALTMTLMYKGIEELLSEVAPGESPILVGSSMGAWIATLYAHRQPELVSRVVAVNGGPLVGDRPDLSLTPADREAARKLMEAIRDPSFGPTPDYVLDDIVDRATDGPIARMSAQPLDLVAHVLEGKLGEVEVPVDLIWGESDQLLSLAYAERMASQLPRSRLTTIPTCGHHPANECPGKLAEKLTAVLAMSPPEARPTPEPQPEPEEEPST